MNLLQSLVFPGLDFASPEEMHLRFNPLAWADLGRRRLCFHAGGCATTDTFYNALAVEAWKGRCGIGALVLRLEGQGEFVVTFGLHRRGRASAWLSEHAVSLNPGHLSHLPVPAWETLQEGLLYVRLRSLHGGCIASAAYATPQSPRHDVRLGLVITHFNRPAATVPAVRRIQSELLARPDLRERLTLTVVDNSRNLPLTSQERLRVLPNENLGGSGGFTRGLLALLDEGRHTHALFMDDDASCEPEAIARTVALLQYSREPRLAVAGALLDENEPWRLMEQGARFDGLCRPLCGGLDMRHVGELLRARQAAPAPDYGGWWFFAFPLRGLRRFPFPFFVRGDDVFFSLDNDFEIATLNGIASFGEDFALKHGPLTAYLDARYHLLHALRAPDRHAQRLLRLARRLFLKPLLSYHYSSARAFTLALRHVLEGPDFFRRNLDLGAVRAEIASWQPSEKLAPLERSGLALRGARQPRESALRRLGRALTLQGFLLPDCLLRDRTTVQPKAHHGSPRVVFRYRRVLYEHAASGMGYIAEHDRARFFAELRAFLRAALALRRRLPALRQAYRSGFEELASARFWRELYGLPEPAGVPSGLPQPALPSALPASSAASLPASSPTGATAPRPPSSNRAAG